MPTNDAIPVAALALALLAASDAHDARAGNARTRYFYANPTSYCQTALPVFDGNVRKRPLSVQNEGTGDAFVTCSFTAQGNELDAVWVYVGSTGANTSVTCTGVTGSNNVGGNQYVTKTVAIPPLGREALVWTGADFAGAPATIPGAGLFNVSCNLPPVAGISDSFVKFIEGIGA